MTGQSRAAAWVLSLLFLASSAVLSSSLFGQRIAGIPAGRTGDLEGGLLPLISRRPAIASRMRSREEITRRIGNSRTLVL